MLVLTRKDGEEILLPQNGITIRVLEIRGNKVRLGITAPAETEVYRREVWERIQHLQTETPVDPPLSTSLSVAPLSLTIELSREP
ncbi:MAG: carbon storage regulator [Gemmataceae bacterium]